MRRQADAEAMREKVLAWARAIVKTYAAHTEPRLSPGQRDELRGLLAQKLTTALAINIPVTRWDAYVNAALTDWERAHGCCGPRVLVVDERAGTFKMA